MFIITLKDIVGLVMLGLVALVFLVLWLLVMWEDWKAKRKAKREARK